MLDNAKYDWQSDVDLLLVAARKAGQVAMSYFRKDPEVWWKNNGQSPVSAADYAANETLETMLRHARPNYGWLSEETDDDADRLSRSTVFVIDPIDGTRAFIGGLDTWCVSVAVVHEGRPVAAALVAPTFNEEYTAIENGIAFKNGQPMSLPLIAPARLKVAASKEVAKHIHPDLMTRIELMPHVPSLAYRLVMVADNRLDATLVRANSQDWDLAAADLILERAGGALVNLNGSKLKYNRKEVSHPALCASASHSLPELLRQLS